MNRGGIALARSPARGVRVVFFDAAGTLFRVRGSVGEGYARLGREFGYDLEGGAVETAFRAAWGAAPPVYGPRGQCEPEEDGESREWCWWRGLVQDVLRHCGVDSGDQARFGAYFGALWRFYGRGEAWELYGDTVPVLQKLAPRYRLGVISNFDGRLEGVLQELGLWEFFEVVTTSAQVGAAKPDPAIFRWALRATGVEADEAVHCGDDPAADWEGAAGAGLRFHALRRDEAGLGGLVDFLDAGEAGEL